MGLINETKLNITYPIQPQPNPWVHHWRQASSWSCCSWTVSWLSSSESSGSSSRRSESGWSDSSSSSSLIFLFFGFFGSFPVFFSISAFFSDDDSSTRRGNVCDVKDVDPQELTSPNEECWFSRFSSDIFSYLVQCKMSYKTISSAKNARLELPFFIFYTWYIFLWSHMDFEWSLKRATATLRNVWSRNGSWHEAHCWCRSAESRRTGTRWLHHSVKTECLRCQWCFRFKWRFLKNVFLGAYVNCRVLSKTYHIIMEYCAA